MDTCAARCNRFAMIAYNVTCCWVRRRPAPAHAVTHTPAQCAFYASSLACLAAMAGSPFSCIRHRPSSCCTGCEPRGQRVTGVRLVCSKVSSSGDDVHTMLDPTSLPSDVGRLADDVLREREAAYATAPSADLPILVRDLRKVFPPMDGNPKKVAVKNVSLKVSTGECFGCGAGRVSLVCLCGLRCTWCCLCSGEATY